MKSLLLIILSLLSVSAFSNTAKISIDIELVNLDLDEEVFNYQCEIRQTLTWESQSNFFKCISEDAPTLILKNTLADIGYHHEKKQAFSIMYFSNKTGFITKMFEKLNIETKLKRSKNGLKVFYAPTKPRSTENEFLIETQDDQTFLLTISNISYL